MLASVISLCNTKSRQNNKRVHRKKATYLCKPRANLLVGRASQVTRTLGWRFVAELLWRPCFHSFLRILSSSLMSVGKRKEKNSKNRRVRPKSQKPKNIKGAIFLALSWSFPCSALLSWRTIKTPYGPDLSENVGIMFSRCVLFHCGWCNKKS